MTRKEMDELAKAALANQAEPEISEPDMLPVETRIDDILSNEEIEEIRKAAREKIAEEEKKARRQAYAQQALNDARRAAGSMPLNEAHEQAMAELVEIYVDMPRLRKVTGGEHEPDPIIIDQRRFFAGRTYRVPRGLALYMNDLMDKARRHVAYVDGRSGVQYDPNRGYMIHQGGVAAGGPGAPSFDAIHHRPPNK
jgi:hypothetical protein